MRTALLATGALLAATLTGAGPSIAAAAPAATTAHVWITTPDGTDKMADLGTVAFGGTPTTVPTVVVDPGRTFQTMTGFGGALTDSSASV
ncbi:MAG TPA: glucan endo-1,6-beta-glucosidase, partial [Micromonosporaceae bacterium]